jgi:hypothetical protein
MAQKLHKVTPQIIRRRQLVLGGLIGVEAVAVIQLAALPSLDLPLTVVVYAFAFSLPCLSMAILAQDYESEFDYAATPLYKDLADTLGMIGGVVGIFALFWHFSLMIGVAFIASSVLAIVYILSYQRLLNTINKR